MAIIDNILQFSIQKTIDGITIDNLGEDITIVLTATLFLQENCSNNSFKQVSEEYTIEDVLTIKIPKTDGTYKVRLKFMKESGEFLYKEYLFTSYKSLLASLIKDTQNVLCDSNCSDCDSQFNVDQIQSQTVLKMLSFYILNRDTYKNYFNAGIDCINCTLLNSINCNTIGSIFYGKPEDDKLYKKLIGYLYYIFYLGEKYTYTCCPEQTDRLFRFQNISKCLLDLNLDIKCIETSILNDPNFSIDAENLTDLTPGVAFP